MDQLDKLAQRLAELFKERSNPPSTSLRLAKVVGANPLKVQWGDSVILSGDKLIVPRRLVGSCVDGDSVIIAPETAEMRRWFVLDIV